MSFVIIDRDNLVFLARVHAHFDAVILDATSYREISTLICDTEIKSQWSKLDRLEAMMLYKKLTGLVMDITAYGDVLGDLMVLARALPETTISTGDTDPPNFLQPNHFPQDRVPTVAQNAIVKPKIQSAEVTPKPPSAKGSTGRVWAIADEEIRLLAEQNDPVDVKKLRGRVIEICTENGIHEATAATQWSKWKKSKGL